MRFFGKKNNKQSTNNTQQSTTKHNEQIVVNPPVHKTVSKRKLKIPTIIGVFLLVIGLAAGVYLIQSRQVFKLGATGEASPKDVRIANINGSSFSVSWTTQVESEGFIAWGKSESSLNQTTSDEVENNKYVHHVTIQNLELSTTYYFNINSNGDSYNNNGTKWKITTGPQLTSPPIISPISGSVLLEDGSPAGNTLVYIMIGGASLLSTTTSQSGNWVLPLSSLRTTDLTSFMQINEGSTIIEIFVQANSQDSSTAKIYPEGARPTPVIIIGETHDFRNTETIKKDDITSAEVELPQEETKESKFDVSDENSESATIKAVTLESLEEGEVVTSTNPEFFGEGPAGAEVTITVESELITDDVTISSGGKWSWSPPSELEEGVHKLTLSWRDENGILRTITRNFIVQAAEGPAFESTPSATPTSSPTPSPTTSPSPTPSPTPTLTPKPTITPSATPTPTDSGLPEAGSLTPTWVLSIMGTGLLIISGVAVIASSSKRNYQ